MSEDLLTHLTPNSNQDDPGFPTKLAMLEARMAGKSAPPPPPTTGSLVKYEEMEQVVMGSDSSDSENDVGGEFLIRAKTQKKQKLEEDDHLTPSKQSEAAAEERFNVVETVGAKVALEDLNRKKQMRGRGRSSVGKGHGSRGNAQFHQQVPSVSTSIQIDKPGNSFHKGIHLKEQLAMYDRDYQEEVVSLRAQIASLEETLHSSCQEVSNHQQRRRQLEKELGDFKDRKQQMKLKSVNLISDILISVSKDERNDARAKARQDYLRLGSVSFFRTGTMLSETLDVGQALKDIKSHLKQLLETKEAVERHRKALKKLQNDKGNGSNAETGAQEEDFLIQDEICKSRLASIKREEESILRERDRYELEKERLSREMKRIRDEDGSRFNNYQIMNQRYILLNLLGKGGSGEVYKAFDFLEYRYVACKLHYLKAEWSEEVKQSYVHHAIREYNIHKCLVHHHIVRLWDIFEIDENAICTVLEYCSGKDLDAVLKATPVLPEKEAKLIIVQIFQGLVYLNKRPQKIIHYDLKPGNVLFDELGVAKVTDFGLSKVVEDGNGTQGMELTPQGAGTYWYLPPECFEQSKTPLISSKVDVWSVGVLLYQMLFGKRPFGHDQTQVKILAEDTISISHRVEFPSRPAVSNEAKDIIRRCLTHNQAERPDVLSIAQDPYFSYTKKSNREDR